MSTRAFVLIAAALLCCAAVLAAVPAVQSQAIINNGTVMLGINIRGELNVAGGPPSFGTLGAIGLGTTFVGLRHLPWQTESTSPGCLCEGWGVGYNGFTSGYANQAIGTAGITPVSFTFTPDTAVSIVTIGVAQVTHDYHPSAATPNLYEATVTITNTGGATINNVLYRRTMDWDVEPTAFNEYVTIAQGPSPPPSLVDSNDNGFCSSNVYSPCGPIISNGPPGCGCPGFTDTGPSDHGAAFNFNLGNLAPAASKDFNIFYGAAGTELEATAALALVNAQLWTFGQPSLVDVGGDFLGVPSTFMFGFDNMVEVPEPAVDFTWAFTTTAPLDYDLDNVQFTDLTPIPAVTPCCVTASYAWDFGDTGTSTAHHPLHMYLDDGVYTVCLTVTFSYSGESNDNTACKPVTVNNRPPTAYYDSASEPLPSKLVHFTDGSSDVDGTITLYGWDFADGSPILSGSGPAFREVEHEFPSGHTYFVCLTVTDDDGATDTYCPPVDANDHPEASGGKAPEASDPEDGVDANAAGADQDGDGIADRDDLCPNSNDGEDGAQADADGDGSGDACDGDDDNDGRPDALDACPTSPDDASDADSDGAPDGCDEDDDGDAVPDLKAAAPLDNCRLDANPAQEDLDRDAVGDACDPDADGDGLADLVEPLGGDGGDGPGGATAAADRGATVLDVDARGSSPPWLWAGVGFLAALALVLAAVILSGRRSA